MIIGWPSSSPSWRCSCCSRNGFRTCARRGVQPTSGIPRIGRSVLAALVAGLIFTLLALTAYHRGWSRFQRRTHLAHAHLTYVSEGSRSARRELARLDSLHRQTVDWLVVLARAVHKPWHVRPEWKEKPAYEVAAESMPFAMRVSTVQENDHGAATRLRRLTVERALARGWRHAAFLDLVREVGAELGEDRESFGIAALDEDLAALVEQHEADASRHHGPRGGPHTRGRTAAADADGRDSAKLPCTAASRASLRSMTIRWPQWQRPPIRSA